MTSAAAGAARVSAGYLLSTPSGLGAANSTRTTSWPLARRTARMRALAKKSCSWCAYADICRARPAASPVTARSAERSGTPGLAPGGAVTERHDGERPLRRQLRQGQQEPGIDLAALELPPGGRRRRDPRVLQQRDLVRFPLRDVLAQRGGVGGGPLRVDHPDGILPAPGAEAGDGRRGVGGEGLRPHHLGDRRRHHDDAGAERIAPGRA